MSKRLIEAATQALGEMKKLDRVMQRSAAMNAAIVELESALHRQVTPDDKPVLWAHQDNPQLTTTREPLGPGWEPLYRREPMVERGALIDPRGSLGEPIV